MGGWSTSSQLRKHKVLHNRRFWQNFVVWITVHSAPGRDIGRLQQKVNNRRLRQAAIVRNVRHENGRILYTTREEWDGRYSQQEEVHN